MSGSRDALRDYLGIIRCITSMGRLGCVSRRRHPTLAPSCFSAAREMATNWLLSRRKSRGGDAAAIVEVFVWASRGTVRHQASVKK